MRFTQRGEPRALTVTQRGARIGFRMVRGRATYRWVRAFPSAEQAAHVRGCVERAIKLAGYTDVDGEELKLPPPDPLQRWKDACLDDADARLVYGDMLSERGDPRAELIAAQAKAEEDEAAAPEAARLRARYTAEIGGLERQAGFLDVRWMRGFIDHVSLGPDTEGEMEYDEYYDERRRYPPSDLGTALLRLGGEPSAELLRSLWIYGGYATPTEEMLAILVALVPMGLERLDFRGGEGDLTDTLDALPRLKRARFEMYRATLRSPVRAPKLVELDIASGIDAAAVRALVDSELPSLDRIHVTGPPLGEAGLGLLLERFEEEWGPPSDDLLL